MAKPKINLRAWEPIEKRKVNNGKDKDKNAINWEGTILDENKRRGDHQISKETPQVIPLEDRRKAKDLELIIDQSEGMEQRIKQGIDSDPKPEKDDVYKTYYYHPVYDEYGHQESVQQDNHYQIAKRGSSSYGKSRSRSKTAKNSFLQIRKPKRKKINVKNMISPELLKTISAGVGAILLGIVFGYAILNYFVKPVVEDANQQDIIQEAGQGAASEQSMQQVIPGKILYYLQAGAFSELEGAQQVQADYINNGRAAVVVGDGPFRVFIGVAAEKASADSLKDSLTAQGMDLYVKELTTPALKTNASENAFGVLSSYITAGEALVNRLSEESIAALASQQYKVNYDGIQKLHQEFLIQAQQIKPVLIEEGLTKEEGIFQGLTEEINYAMSAFRAYEKTPNPQYLWNVQNALLKYKLTYEELAQL